MQIFTLALLVPVLIDRDGLVIFEKSSILRYTTTQYSFGPSWPEAPAAPDVDKWVEGVEIDFDGDFIWDVLRPLECIPASQHDYLTITAAPALTEKELAIAGKVLKSHACIAQDDFSLADIQLGHCMKICNDIDVARADLPHQRAYNDWFQSRPACSRHWWYLVKSYA